MPRFQTLRAALLRALPPRVLRAVAPPLTAADVPLRAELFSAEQMERHGKTLAQTHHLSAAPGQDTLLLRLEDNEDKLQSACTQLLESVGLDRRITPASEWLLENFYLIE